MLKILLSILLLTTINIVVAADQMDEMRQLEQLANLNNVTIDDAVLPDVNKMVAMRNKANNIDMLDSIEEEQREEAFDNLLDDMYPMTTEQILAMRNRYEDIKRVESASFVSPPKPTITSELVKLSPGSTPPVIRLAQGFVSTLVFLDSTGAPWPVVSYNIGDPNAFDLQWNKVDNVIAIQAKTLFKYGNLLVRLENLATPIVITLLPGQQHVDYRRELRVQGFGPKAQSYVEDLYPDKENSVLLSVLDGVPPVGSVAIETSDGGVSAWMLSNKMFIRTLYRVLSPAWVSSVTSADGMHAYEINFTSELLVSKNGSVTTVTFKE